MARRQPMPSPRGTNHENLHFSPRRGAAGAAYDEADPDEQEVKERLTRTLCTPAGRRRMHAVIVSTSGRALADEFFRRFDSELAEDDADAVRELHRQGVASALEELETLIRDKITDPEAHDLLGRAVERLMEAMNDGMVLAGDELPTFGKNGLPMNAREAETGQGRAMDGVRFAHIAIDDDRSYEPERQRGDGGERGASMSDKERAELYERFPELKNVKAGM